MLRKLACGAAVLLATTSVASARHYYINLDGYCDILDFDIDKSIVVGASVGTSSDGVCDNAYVVGTVVQLGHRIAPGGTAAVLASDYGNPSTSQYVIYINLTNHTFVEYSTYEADRGQYALAGTWSAISQGADRSDLGRAPSLTAMFAERATRVAR